MRGNRSSRVVFVVASAVSLSVGACGGESASKFVSAVRAKPSSPLREGVVDQFEPRSAGLGANFRGGAGPVTARTLFPKQATAPLHIEDAASKAALQVTLKDTRAVKAEPADGYLVYSRAHASGATLLHRPLPEGTEDFLAFETAPEKTEISYELTPAAGLSGLRLVANTLELVDEGGAPRLRVEPPYIVGADGARTDAILAVDDCAVDRNPAAPWGRAVTAPGARTCTVRVSWPRAGVAYPAVLDPRWTTTGSMTTARQDHTGTPLSTGRVLVAGGRSSAASTTGLASAELFDRTTGTWAATTSMTGGRFFHSATQLNTSSNATTGGKVLIAGGINGTASLNTAELYSASAGTWVGAANLNAARHAHTATLLSNGRVLVAGGQNASTVLNTAAVYDPTTGAGAWTATGNMASARRFHTATRLVVPGNSTLNNKVLVAGGNSGGTTSLTSAQLFDGTNWTAAPAFTSAREGHTATALANGNVLVTGGRSGTTTLSSTQLFNAGSGGGSWGSAGTMNAARQAHTATLLATAIVKNGQVLLAGGSSGTASLGSAELWNGTSTWTPTTALPAAVQGHTATVLGDNKVLIAGGANGGTTTGAAAVYDASFGVACTSNGQCSTGFCVNGVCCDSACNSGCGACNLANKVGTCSPVNAGTVCRASTGTCDAAETCNGTSLACPANAFAAATTVCRAAAGSCDAAENCTGTSATCPANTFLSSTTTCRAAAGPCDVAETCNGSSATCPTNQFASSTTVCRTVAGTCDAAERCNGTAATCPADVVEAFGTPCRASQGICDAIETCDGTSNDCPPDQLAVAGAICRPSNGACDTADACTGTQMECPPDESTCNVQTQTFPITVTLPGSLQPRQVLMATSNSLDIEQNVNLSGPTRPIVAEMGTAGTVVRTGASNQDLYSVGNVQLDGAQVSGKVLAEGTVQQINGATVAGGVTRGPIGRRTLTIMPLTFPSRDGGSLDIGDKQVVHLLRTGAYRDVYVRSGATLTLSGGQYTFNTFVTEWGSTVVINDSVAPLEIGVKSTFIHRGTYVPSSGSGARTLIVYVGTAETFVESPLSASVIAPNAKLTLGSSPNVTHSGSFFARDILVRPGTWLVHVPSEAIELPLIGVTVPPTGIEPIPGYDPGSLVCTAGLILGPVATDANGVVYRQSITYPTDTVPPTGPGCRVPIQFCNDNEQVIPSPPQADFNSTVPASSSCPAVGGPSSLCGIDPATAGGPCTTDADCPGAICAAQCTTAACTHTERRCGNYYASCGGIPAEPTNCDQRVFRQCADPNAVGTVTAAQAAAQVQPLNEPPPEILMAPDERQIPLPYVTLQGGYCASPPLEPPVELRGDKGDAMNMGNDQWGFFIEPELSSLFTMSKKLLKEQSFQMGIRVGAAAGAKVFGYKITALKATIDIDLQNCGQAIGLDLRVFGDSIASIDSVDGIKTGLGPLQDFGNTKKTKDEDNAECLSKFKDRDKKSEDLKKLVYSARNAKEFYTEKGTSKELCQRTNTQLGLAFNCDDPDLVGSIDVPNAWIEEYDQAGRDYEKNRKAFSLAADKITGSAEIGLFDKRRPYHTKIFQTTFPIGPVTVSVAIDGFGEWHFSGAVQLGAIYGGGLVQGLGELMLGPFKTLLGPLADIKLVAGPVITPGASIGVIVFAGAGIPGVSIGLEGALQILGVSMPLDARLAAARTPDPDTRDVNQTDFAGVPFEGMDQQSTQHWRYGWAAGSRLIIDGLNGQLDGVVRVRLLFARKTFRRNITKWTGFKTVIPILAASGGIGQDSDPIVATDDFGVYADRIAHTNVIPLDTSVIIGNPDPNAHYPGTLGQEPCIVIP